MPAEDQDSTIFQGRRLPDGASGQRNWSFWTIKIPAGATEAS